MKVWLSRCNDGDSVYNERVFATEEAAKAWADQFGVDDEIIEFEVLGEPPTSVVTYRAHRHIGWGVARPAGVQWSNGFHWSDEPQPRPDLLGTSMTTDTMMADGQGVMRVRGADVRSWASTREEAEALLDAAVAAWSAAHPDL